MLSFHDDRPACPWVHARASATGWVVFHPGPKHAHGGVQPERSSFGGGCRPSAHLHMLVSDIQRARTHSDEGSESLLAAWAGTSFGAAEDRNEKQALAMPRRWNLSRRFRDVRNRLCEVPVTGSDIAFAIAGPKRREVGASGIDTIRRRLGILRRHRHSRAVQPLCDIAAWETHMRHMVLFRFRRQLRRPGHRGSDVSSGSATHPDLRPPRQRDPDRVQYRLGNHRSTAAPVQRQAWRSGQQGWPLLRRLRACRRCDRLVAGTRLPAVDAGLSFGQGRDHRGRRWRFNTASRTSASRFAPQLAPTLTRQHGATVGRQRDTPSTHSQTQPFLQGGGERSEPHQETIRRGRPKRERPRFGGRCGFALEVGASGSESGGVRCAHRHPTSPPCAFTSTPQPRSILQISQSWRQNLQTIERHTASQMRAMAPASGVCATHETPACPTACTASGPHIHARNRGAGLR